MAAAKTTMVQHWETAAETELASLPEDLTCWLGEEMERLEREKQQLATERAALSVLAEQAERVERLLGQLQQELSGLEAAETAIGAEYTLAYGEAQGVAQTLEELVRQLPEDLRTPADYHGRCRLLAARCDHLATAYETAKASWEEQKEKWDRQITDVQVQMRLAAEAAQRLERAEQQFAAVLGEAGLSWSDFAQAKALDAEAMALATQDYDNRCQQAGERVAMAEQEVRGLAMPDLGELQTTLAEVQARREEVARQHGEKAVRLSQNQQLLGRISESQAQLDMLEQAYRSLGELAQVARGNNEARLSFERYVLAAYFEEVISAANRRLTGMSDGRYSLLRRQERGKGNVPSGLDVDVLDQYTGRVRGAKTLSGGESFQASLALALGLADVVQAYTGGMQLDTIFIDEGFGTLDPEALDGAVRCLFELQRTGRLVGVISHVPELKEAIDAWLEVTADRTGSRAGFRLL